jgi:hypothetical protein
MYKKLTIAVLLILSTACTKVSTTSMNPGLGQALRNRQVVITQRERPNFVAETPGKAMLGLTGAALMVVAGNSIVRENAIEDPAVHIARQLSDVLEQHYATRTLADALQTKEKDIAKICSAKPDADLILDVRTLSWSASCFMTSWNKYKVTYTVSVRLIDAKSRKVIAEGAFGRVPAKATPDAPTHKELLANNAAWLKAELNRDAELCVQDFKKRILLVE